MRVQSPRGGCWARPLACFGVAARHGLQPPLLTSPTPACIPCGPAAPAFASTPSPSCVAQVSGYGRQNYLREGGKLPRVDAANIEEALDKSLARLGTDYVDLLQVRGEDPYERAYERGTFHLVCRRQHSAAGTQDGKQAGMSGL